MNKKIVFHNRKSFFTVNKRQNAKLIFLLMTTSTPSKTYDASMEQSLREVLINPEACFEFGLFLKVNKFFISNFL